LSAKQILSSASHNILLASPALSSGGNSDSLANFKFSIPGHPEEAKLRPVDKKVTQFAKVEASQLKTRNLKS